MIRMILCITVAKTGKNQQFLTVVSESLFYSAFFVKASSLNVRIPPVDEMNL